MDLHHHWRLLRILVGFFRKSYGRWYATLTFCGSICFVICFLLTNLPEEFFVAHNSKRIEKGDFCVFAYINSPQKYTEQLRAIIGDLYDTKKIYFIDRGEYEAVSSRPDDLLYVDQCPTMFFVKKNVALNRTAIKVDVDFDLIVPTKEVTNFDPWVYYTQSDRPVLGSLYTVSLRILNLLHQRNVDIFIRETFFYDNFNHYYLLNMDLPLRLFFILRAFEVAPFRLMFILRRDIRSRFVDTIGTKGVSFLYYLFAQYLWSLPVFHILLMAIVYTALVIELELVFTWTVLILLPLGLLMLSLDMHLSATFVAMRTMKSTSLMVTSWLLLNTLSYLMFVSYFDNFTSIYVYFYPWLSYLDVIMYIFPGYPFKDFMRAVTEHSSRVRINFAQMYSINSPFTTGKVATQLAIYLAVFFIKIGIVYITFRCQWDNINEKPRLCVFRSKSGKKEQAAPMTTEDSDGQKKEPEASTDTTNVAISLRGVCKRLASHEAHLENVSLNIKYTRVTVLYSLSEFSGLSAVCKLCAGFMRPDSGTVDTFAADPTKPARIAYIITRGFLFEMLTVREYLYLLGRIQQDSEKTELVFNAAIDRLLTTLRLKESEHQKASQLSSLEQVKLSVAFAILGRSNVLLFDCPSLELNLDEKREFWSLLLMLSSNRAVFVTTNSMEEADFVASKLYILLNGTIQFRGTTEALRSKSTGNFVLRIARRSLMNQKDIEKMLSQCAKLEMKLREATISEFVYVFNCRGEESRKETMKLLDRAMEKARGGKLVLNQLAMNTIDDQLVEQLLDEEAGEKRAEKKQNTVTAPLEASNEAIDAGSSSGRSVKQMSYCHQMRVLLWRRMIIGHRRLFILLYLIPYAFIVDLIPLMLVKFILRVDNRFQLATDDMLSHGQVSVKLMQNSTAAVLRSYCEREEFQHSTRCQILDRLQPYQEWIYQHASTFHQFGQEYLYSYTVDQINETAYRVTAFLNERSKHAKSFGMMHFINHFASKVFNLDFALKYTSTVHYPEGSNMVEILFVICLMSNLLTLTMMFFCIPCNLVHNNEKKTGMQLMLLANGITFHVYSISGCITACIYMLVMYLPCNPIGLLLNLAHPIASVSVGNYFQWLTIYFIYSMYSTVFLQLLVSIGMLFALFVFLGLIFIKNALLALTILGGPMSIGWYVFINELFNILSPCNTYTTAAESMLLRLFNISHSIDQYRAVTNLGTHYDYYWNVSPFRFFIEMLFSTAIIYYIISKHEFWRYLLYKRTERKQGFLRLIFDRDSSILTEDHLVERAVKSGNWPSDAVLVVHKLSKFSKRKFIDQISFVVRRGQCFGLLGLKGSAKSDLLLILAGQSVFDDGNFYLNKFDSKKAAGPFKRLPGVSYAPQYNCHHDMLTVEEVLMLFAKMRNVPEKQIWSEIRRIGHIFQLQDDMKKLGGLLSEQSKRAFTLALAFIGGPQLVLLDEPTHAVNVTKKQLIWQMIKHAHAVYKPAILVASKDIEEVESLAERVAVLIQGGLHYIGGVGELRGKYCTGLQIHIKIKPNRLQEMKKQQQFRLQMLQALPGIRAIITHRYYMYYFLRQSRPKERNSSEGENYRSLKWSTVFGRLEKLCAEFEFEAYTISVGSLEQIFFAYSKKHRLAGGASHISGTSSDVSSRPSTTK